MCYYTYLHFRQEGLLLAFYLCQKDSNKMNLIFLFLQGLVSYYMVVKEQVDNA